MSYSGILLRLSLYHRMDLYLKKLYNLIKKLEQFSLNITKLLWSLKLARCLLLILGVNIFKKHEKMV